VGADASFVARRTKRHLDDLERANYVDASGAGDDASELAQRRKEAEEEGIAVGLSLSRYLPF
jgi:TnpA family transposase